MVSLRSAVAVLLVFCTGIVLSGCDEKQSDPQPPAASTAEKPIPVGVVELYPEPFTLTIELPGRTRAFRMAQVRPQVNGILEKRLFVEGTNVKKDQQLYQIDSSMYQAALKSAEASLMSARSLAERYALLVKERAVSRQAYDEARAAHLQAEAAVEQARINLRYTKVLAPLSGRIGRSLMTEGALVSSAQSSPLAVIHQLDPIYVDATQPSRELLRLRQAMVKGQLHQVGENSVKVYLTLEDGTEYAESGTLEFSEVSVDEGTGSVTLRAVFPNPDRLLLPGMFVRARLAGGIQEQAILAPQQGITRNSQGQAVAMVVGADNRVEARQVETRQTMGDRWLIGSGLQAGDRLITEGLQYIRPGALVQPSPATNVAATAAGKE